MNFQGSDWHHIGLRTDKRERSPVQWCVIAIACLRAAPTWLLTRLIEPWLPSYHAWCGRKFSLFEWRIGQTPQCIIFDYIFWIYGGCAIFALFRIWL
jgi:hypothetical protein